MCASWDSGSKYKKVLLIVSTPGHNEANAPSSNLSLHALELAVQHQTPITKHQFLLLNWQQVLVHEYESTWRAFFISIPRHTRAFTYPVKLEHQPFINTRSHRLPFQIYMYFWNNILILPAINHRHTHTKHRKTFGNALHHDLPVV